MAEVPIFTRIKPNAPIDKSKQIWTELFRCSIPFIHTQTQNEVRRFGLPTTGSSSHDSQMHHRPVDIMITINHMVEYFKTGVTVTVTRHEDTKIIYDIIKDYLNSWNSRLTSGINTARAPIDDLILLDSFAKVVHPFAASHFKSDENGLSIMRQFSGNSWVSRNSLDKTSVSSSIDLPKPKYESIGQILTEKVLARDKARR